jgi:hypothetical protein
MFNNKILNVLITEDVCQQMKTLVLRNNLNQLGLTIEELKEIEAAIRLRRYLKEFGFSDIEIEDMKQRFLEERFGKDAQKAA